MPPVKTHTDELAGRLVDEAGRLLTTAGPQALTTRAVAAAAGTSTTAVYALFGDKPGLVRQMYVEGFRRLGDALRALPVTADPLADLLALGLAYRRAALANPHLYELMFGSPVPGFVPDAPAREVADAAYRPLLDGVRRCLDAGALRPLTPGADAAEDMAVHLWATVHGLVGLELNGWLGEDERDRDRRVEAALRAAGAGYLPD